MVKKNIIYTWEELAYDVDDLVKSLKFLNFSFKNIYGIPRGGLVLAVMLSHRLNLPMIYSAAKVSSDTLIVDDISNTGKTLKKIMKKDSVVVTLWASNHTKVIPLYYSHLSKKDERIIFPFENIKKVN